MTARSWREAVDRGDLDELLRWVDRLADAGDWDGLVALAAAARSAHERGRQLWPATTHAHHRLALGAPAAVAALVLDTDDRFALGPLTEVVACGHTWEELAPHLQPGPTATVVAHERALRGERVARCHTDLLVDVFDVPPDPEPWEPAWPRARYEAHAVDADPPPAVTFATAPVPTTAGEVVDDPDTTDALVGAVRHWVDESNGRVEAVVVAGPVTAALGALGPRRVRLAAVDGGTALAHLAWAAASGGAHGRRRGAARGRFEAWWVAATLTDTPWPPGPGELGRAVAAARWWVWDVGDPATGWVLRLAGELPGEGLAWALGATDHRW